MGIVVHVVQVAKQMKLKKLYVHVEANNQNASALYDNLVPMDIVVIELSNDSLHDGEGVEARYIT